MRAKTQELFDKLDNISFDLMDEPTVDTSVNQKVDQDSLESENDYFDYYSDELSSPQSSRDSYSRSLDTSVLDLLSQFDSFKGRTVQIQELQSNSFVRFSQVKQVEFKPPTPDKSSTKHFNHNLFQGDLKILKSSSVNNMSILDCMTDMAINDHESIMNELQSFIEDVQKSVPNNTFIVDLKRKLKDKI